MDSPAQKRACWLLGLSLICCVFEGALRKWVVGDTSIAGRVAFLSKDVVLSLFLLQTGMATKSIAATARPFLTTGLFLIAIGSFLSSAWGVEAVGAVLTLITFILLPTAAWFAGRCLPSDALVRFARWVSILTILICPLAVLQFYAPAGSAINRYSMEAEGHIALSGVSERVRATGTFSYITGFGEFAELAVWSSIVTFSMAQKARQRWLGYVAFFAACCCALVTVSRSVVLISLILIGSWALLGGQIRRKLEVVATIAVVGLVVLMATNRWNEASEVTSTVYLRNEATQNDSFGHRLWYQYVMPLYAVEISPIGNGLGSEQAGRTVGPGAKRAGSTFESPWGRTVMELGVFGLVGFLVTLGVAFAPCKSIFQNLPNGGSKVMLAVTAASLATRALVGFQFNHVAAYFFWAMAACILAMGTEQVCKPLNLPCAFSHSGS